MCCNEVVLTRSPHRYLQSNFATLDPKTNIVVSRRADRNFEDLGPPLCSYLNHLYARFSPQSMKQDQLTPRHREIPGFPEYQVDFKYATEHRYTDPCRPSVCASGEALP